MELNHTTGIELITRCKESIELKRVFNALNGLDCDINAVTNEVVSDLYEMVKKEGGFVSLEIVNALQEYTTTNDDDLVIKNNLINCFRKLNTEPLAGAIKMINQSPLHIDTTNVMDLIEAILEDFLTVYNYNIGWVLEVIQDFQPTDTTASIIRNALYCKVLEVKENIRIINI